MVFPQYKEWMGENCKLSQIHIEGVREFIEYAQLTANDFPCPCTKCRNGKLLNGEIVELHLLRSGMQRDYTFWKFHGERLVPYVPKHLRISRKRARMAEEEELQESYNLNDLVDDAFEVHGTESDPNMNFNVEPDVSRNDVAGGTDNDNAEAIYIDDDYIRLKAEATRPLYTDCKSDHTTLYAMVRLHNIKSKFGLSGLSITEILKWGRDLLPEDNTLPDNYPHMRKCLKGLGMKYKSIHACKFDCVLYRKEFEHLDTCPVCGEPRYVPKEKKRQSVNPIDETSSDSDKVKSKTYANVPQKVLKYFPVMPRLKRLYSVSWIAEAMTWHARAEVGGDLMRHPVDSSMWQGFNGRYPEFASETRNVRLGIATDGFNPFGNLSNTQSIWPVILIPYNLPPSLCMKKDFSMLSLLIPGPLSPSDDIDVFLAPLIEELNELWVNGVKAFDHFKKEQFTLKAMLLWAIHDFPAYGTLSGCNTHGYFACPICGEETESEQLKESQKICYTGHRRFLPPDDKLRKDKHNFLPPGIETRSKPKKLYGTQIEAAASKVTQNLRGKHPKVKAMRNKQKLQDEKVAYSRRSILYDLPYWKMHPVRHVLDIMHAEKNIIEHLVNTCLGGAGSKDSVKARIDLKSKQVKRGLWIQKDGTMPAGAFLLSSEERKLFLDTLSQLRVPSKFSSDLNRLVNYPTHDLRRCKSHDWHIIMQLVPLLFKHCFSSHSDLRRAIFQISVCFTLLCAKVVNKNHLQAAKLTMVEATCILEKYFPHSFFDISIHLLVHLCDEALICGPVRYRWMYPIERLMKIFKDNVMNQRYLVGSIAEQYITDEASFFAANYFPDQRGIRERYIDEDDEFADEEALGKAKIITLTPVQYEQVARYVFETHDGIDEWKEKYEKSPQNQRQDRESSSRTPFRAWVKAQLLKKGDVKSRLARLANGPIFIAEEFGQYRVNGFTFSSYDREKTSVGKQNSGISYKAITPFRASARDRNVKEAEWTYYGIVKQIIRLDYTSFQEVVFFCDWVKVEDKTACKVDPATNLVMVDLNKLKSNGNLNDEPFFCAFQNLKQVFYSKYINNDPWSVVLYSPKQLTTSVDALEAPTEFQSALDDNPHLRNFLNYLTE